MPISPAQLHAAIRRDAVTGSFNVGLEHSGLEDGDVPAVMSALAAAIRAGAPAFGDVLVSLALEQNRLTGHGVAALCAASLVWAVGECPLSRVALRRLRVHQNAIGDEGAEALAAYLSDLPPPLLPHEVHLSHNRVTAKGALAIVAAAEGRYPRAAANGGPAVPLWLRLEHNNVDVGAFNDGCAARSLVTCGCQPPAGAAVGGRGRGGRGRGGGGSSVAKCGPSLCLRNASNAHAGRPLVAVHVPFVGEQARAGEGEGGVTVAALAGRERVPQTSSLSSADVLYIVLDTSAIVHMAAGLGEFNFGRLGMGAHSGHGTPTSLPGGPFDGSAVFVLLDTVLQQLDDNKGAEKGFAPATSAPISAGRSMARASVNSFMRTYPVLARAGALVTLSREDAEDVVRSGGMNVATVPGLRGLDGRLDSDGLIVDAALVLSRGIGRAGSVLLATADIRQRNRASEAGLAAVLVEELGHRLAAPVSAPYIPFTCAFLTAVLPEDVRSILTAPTLAPAALPHLELMRAAETVEVLSLLLQEWVDVRNAEEAGLAERTASALASSSSVAAVWRSMAEARRSATSLHAALYRTDRAHPSPVPREKREGKAAAAPPLQAAGPASTRLRPAAQPRQEERAAVLSKAAAARVHVEAPKASAPAPLPAAASSDEEDEGATLGEMMARLGLGWGGDGGKEVQPGWDSTEEEEDSEEGSSSEAGAKLRLRLPRGGKGGPAGRGRAPVRGKYSGGHGRGR
jgi:hypothetical protein